MTSTTRFSAETLITLPRRGSAIPNAEGSRAFFSQSVHVLNGTTTKSHHILDIETGEITDLLLEDAVTDVVWLGHDPDTILYLAQGDGGHTLIKIIDTKNPSRAPIMIDAIEAPVNGLKVKALKDGTIVFLVVGLKDAQGTLYNKELHKVHHSGRVTDNINPRIWDTYVEQQKHTVWYTTMTHKTGTWTCNRPLIDILAGTKLNIPLFMYEPGDPTENFDIGDNGIVYCATGDDIDDPDKSPSSGIFFIPFVPLRDSSTNEPRRISPPKDDAARTGSVLKWPQWYSNPQFHPDGSTVAFLGYPEKRSLDPSILIKYPESPDPVDVFASLTGKSWHLVPERFSFSLSGRSLYIQAWDCGRVSLYKLELVKNAYPSLVLRTGSVTSYYVISGDQKDSAKLLVTSSSLVEPWCCQVLEVEGSNTPQPRIVSSIAQDIDIGLSRNQISETHFQGAGDQNQMVHAWVIKPSHFDAAEKYPLCLHVHGGPYSAWNDAWSTRWNPAVWAEQGYIVVTPNIAGSVGWGVELTTALRGEYGGRPYEDLIRCLDHVKDIPGIDVENAVAAGNSYGGYMMNWMQGHSLGRRFKALVCHNGIFNMPYFLLESDCLAAFGSEFGGDPLLWSNTEWIERWNPARPDLLRNWKTPMLIVHSDKDYRIPINHGIAAFHTLKALGVPARFLSFPDENHWVTKPENSLEWHRQVFAWINRWSGAKIDRACA